MFLFLKFLLAHILGDFVFQPEKWVKDKEEKKVKSAKLYLHIGVHAILLLLVIQFNLQEYWLGFINYIISHYTIDVLKLYLQKKENKTNLVFYRSSFSSYNLSLCIHFIC